MNTAEINRLYTTYGFIIYGRCCRILSNRDEAQDALQVVFMKLTEAYESIIDKEKVVPWIFKCAQNYCFNLLRSRKRMVETVDADLVSCEGAADSLIVDRNLISLVLRYFNKAVVDAVYYTYVEELDQQEIYRITGLSPATIRRNLKRFRDAVPGILKRLEVR